MGIIGHRKGGINIVHHDATEKAGHVLTEIKTHCFSLSELSMRGHVSPELEYKGVKEYLKIHSKP